jgi:hypothetical protein
MPRLIERWGSAAHVSHEVWQIMFLKPTQQKPQLLGCRSRRLKCSVLRFSPPLIPCEYGLHQGSFGCEMRIERLFRNMQG